MEPSVAILQAAHTTSRDTHDAPANGSAQPGGAPTNRSRPRNGCAALPPPRGYPAPPSLQKLPPPDAIIEAPSRSRQSDCVIGPQKRGGKTPLCECATHRPAPPPATALAPTRFHFTKMLLNRRLESSHARPRARHCSARRVRMGALGGKGCKQGLSLAAVRRRIPGSPRIRTKLGNYNGFLYQVT